MECPRCHSGTKLKRLQDVAVEACPSCSGMFLDHGELNRVAEPTQGDLEYSTVHEDSLEHDDRFLPINCPRCRSEMDKVEFNIYTGIVLDYCPDCEGFWLDGGELERINEEVRRLNESSGDEKDPPQLWFARFIWSLPR